jgi:hypothetical protein
MDQLKAHDVEVLRPAPVQRSSGSLLHAGALHRRCGPSEPEDAPVSWAPGGARSERDDVHPHAVERARETAWTMPS